MKAVQFTQVEFIKSLLRQSISRETILTKYVKKWPKSSHRTIDRRIDIAKNQLEDEQRKIMASNEQSIIESSKSIIPNIMALIERQELLSKIAKGEITIEKTVFIGDQPITVQEPPDIKSRISAIAELNKIDGSYAAQKHKITSVKIGVDDVMDEYL